MSGMVMKKIYLLLYIIATTTSSHVFAAITANDINQAMTNIHTQAFDVNNLFAKQIKTADLAKWLNIAGYVKDYVITNSKDLFGTQDPLLTAAAESAMQANSKFVRMIQMANSTQHYTTKQLITIAQLSQYIQDQMIAIRETIKGTKFILNRKKNAAALLLNFTLRLEVTAKKAVADSRKAALLLIGSVQEDDSNIPEAPTRIPAPGYMPPTRPLPAHPNQPMN
jgi:hypothetical protein